VDVFLANSQVVQRRIQDTYGRDAEILHPPHNMDPSAPQEPVVALSDLDPGFALVVSRLMAYKNVDAAIEAVRLTGRPLVVIGHGPEAARLRKQAGPHVRILSGLTDSQLRWVYARAGVLVSPSHEDFGLTPLEARPSAYRPWRSGPVDSSRPSSRAALDSSSAIPRRG
jgi:glycosyltransferase involved in cell wall biosynthesis